MQLDEKGLDWLSWLARVEDTYRSASKREEAAWQAPKTRANTRPRPKRQRGQ